MASIDLSDDYYSVPVALTDQKYLLFKFEGQLYKFVCLPNGLSSAPRIFTKLLKPVFSALHKQGQKIMFILNSKNMTITLTDEKQTKIVEHIKILENKKDLKIRDLAKFLDMSEAALPAVHFGRLNTWNLLKIKNNALKISKGNYESKCRLNDASHIELKWWIKNVSYKNRINTPTPCVTIYSDPCPTGWGAACGNLSTGEIGLLKNHKNT